MKTRCSTQCLGLQSATPVRLSTLQVGGELGTRIVWITLLQHAAAMDAATFITGVLCCHLAADPSCGSNCYSDTDPVLPTAINFCSACPAGHWAAVPGRDECQPW